MRAALLLGCLLFWSSAPVVAQAVAPPDVRSTSALVAGGALGATAGVVAGALAGGALSWALTNCDDQDGCLGDYANGAFHGAAVGSSLLVPLGVHWANGKRGSYSPAALASAGVAAVGVGAFWAVQKSEGPDALMVGIVVAIPVIQTLASIAIERRTERRGR